MAFSLLEITPKAAKITDEGAGSQFLQIKMGYDKFSYSYSQVSLLSCLFLPKELSAFFP